MMIWLNRFTRQHLGRYDRYGYVVLACLILMGLSGCNGLFQPRPTITPIFVTVTPQPLLATATVNQPTPVVATVPSELSTALSALPTATQTVPPPAPPTMTKTFTVTPTDTKVPAGSALNLTLPPVATGFAPGVVGNLGSPGNCTIPPTGGFGAIYGRDPNLQAALGCPASNAVPINSAVQDFENGRMVWVSQLGDIPAKYIYVLYNTGSYVRVDDTWIEGVDPASGGEVAPGGRFVPVRGFGKVWRSIPGVQQNLGWGTTGENGTTAQIQRFERGEMVYIIALNQTFIFISGQRWQADGTPF